MENYFVKLNGINVSDKAEQKNGLTYLSWAWAWGEVKKIHPDAIYTIYENKDGWNYHTDGRTGWVKTGVTINGIEHIEYLPIMNFRNKSIVVEDITSFDVNKAIQRSLTKAVARHGLGLYIYAGEDLPENETTEIKKSKTPIKKEWTWTSGRYQGKTMLKSANDKGFYDYIKLLKDTNHFSKDIETEYERVKKFLPTIEIEEVTVGSGLEEIK